MAHSNWKATEKEILGNGSASQVDIITKLPQCTLFKLGNLQSHFALHYTILDKNLLC